MVLEGPWKGCDEVEHGQYDDLKCLVHAKNFISCTSIVKSCQRQKQRQYQQDDTSKSNH